MCRLTVEELRPGRALTLFVFARCGRRDRRAGPSWPSAHGRPAGRRPGARGGAGRGRHDRDDGRRGGRRHPGRAAARTLPPARVLLRGAPRPGVCAAAHRRGRDRDLRRARGLVLRPAALADRALREGDRAPGRAARPGSAWASRRRRPCGSCPAGRPAWRGGCAGATMPRTRARPVRVGPGRQPRGHGAVAPSGLRHLGHAVRGHGVGLRVRPGRPVAAVAAAARGSSGLGQPSRPDADRARARSDWRGP